MATIFVKKKKKIYIYVPYFLSYRGWVVGAWVEKFLPPEKGKPIPTHARTIKAQA